MHTNVLKISPLSDYYIYAPSTLAKKIYLYPLSVGYYIYEPDYYISRRNFDSFLIMYIAKGSCSLRIDGHSHTASAGAFVLLDCYAMHSYESSESWETLWLHFDGSLARPYYQEIVSRFGPVLFPENTQTVKELLNKIYHCYKNAQPIVESTLSGYITAILNELLLPKSNLCRESVYPDAIACITSYINEHFHEQISLNTLAAKAHLSLYHFTRIFSRETGFTPHQYLISTRLSAAKFMLKSSHSSIKDIAFSTGFHSESNFCTTFKKWEGLTPGEYRQNSRQ